MDAGSVLTGEIAVQLSCSVTAYRGWGGVARPILWMSSSHLSDSTVCLKNLFSAFVEYKYFFN